MNKLPRLTGKQIIKALNKAGFKVIRIKGSHHFLQHYGGRKKVVPVHPGETIGPGLLLKILKDCELSRDDFLSLI